MTDLRARLAALIENWQQRERQYRHLRPHDEATADTLRGCAKELAALLGEPPAEAPTPRQIEGLRRDLSLQHDYDTLRARFSALVADLKALPTLTTERDGYVQYFVAQADVWRLASDLAALLREPPEACTCGAANPEEP